MELISRLGLFLLLFGVIIITSKIFLSRRTQDEIDDLDDTVPSYFRTQTRWMVRLIIIFILIIILWLVLSNSP
ncbi:MAG: hypothetical protein CMG71_01640 [Candidatus Marinimicrobia bacterium]|nr:hypothetical protein [Candidatus Neomarinimicrobiota bacterium]|tara:strand:+ start:3067 stop:3285 length:219 start_codon:yes stop_codon:yes gene_type:complete